VTAYSRGTHGEKKARRQLEEDGYLVVESRGSHGFADLWAAKPGQLLFVQVKRSTTGYLSPLDRQVLWEKAAYAWAEPIVAFEPRPRKPMVFRRLTGVGVGDSEEFVTDEVGAA
jgi:Holliday junction resolvase